MIGVPKETDETIDLNKLRIPEPILFFDELVLFEDELADNGTALCNIKVVRVLIPFSCVAQIKPTNRRIQRVMPSGFYCLMRFFMRVDDVLIRVKYIEPTSLYYPYLA